MHTEFQRLVVDDASFPASLRGFMSRNFKLKVVADCGTDPDAGISREEAEDALEEASAFLAAVEASLDGPGP